MTPQPVVQDNPATDEGPPAAPGVDCMAAFWRWVPPRTEENE